MLRRHEEVYPPIRRATEAPPTAVTAVHAHLASIRTHVALQALHRRLTGAQARHLLAVVPDRAHGIAAARWREEEEEEEED